jgi:cell fate regulator YaaT (PSP1 superfamily)
VVVQTHRGLELGTVLERVRTPGRPPNGHDEHETDAEFVRAATDEDLAIARRLREEADASWKEWIDRIAQWKLELELLDLEWTLDRQKLILYVLAGRGPDTTKLALFAAAKGFPVDVQPVAAEGLVTLSNGGCGSGSCGCHE